MKLLALAAAAAIALTSMPSVAVAAQDQRMPEAAQDQRMREAAHDRVETRTTTTTTRHVTHRGWRNKRVCKVRWHNHRKVRTCRMVRVRH